MGQWDRIDVRADLGGLADRGPRQLRATLAEGGDSKKYQAITADTYAKEQADTIKDNLSFFNTFLLVFTLIALFVGTFIIYNTFSITVQHTVASSGCSARWAHPGGRSSAPSRSRRSWSASSRRSSGWCSASRS